MSDEQRLVLERNIGFIRGPRFFTRDDEVMFTFGIDPNNVIGPRAVTEADKREHAAAWSAFMASLPQLDHDGDGEPGGSLPAPKNRGGRPRKVRE